MPCVCIFIPERGEMSVKTRLTLCERKNEAQEVLWHRFTQRARRVNDSVQNVGVRPELQRFRVSSGFTFTCELLLLLFCQMRAMLEIETHTFAPGFYIPGN